MRFLVDNQLPRSLVRFLASEGHDALHVEDVGLGEATDLVVWERALSEQRVVVSKDEDFLYLANRAEDHGQFLWIRLGNCRKPALLAAFAQTLAVIEESFLSGQRVVELG